MCHWVIRRFSGTARSWQISRVPISSHSTIIIPRSDLVGYHRGMPWAWAPKSKTRQKPRQLELDTNLDCFQGSTSLSSFDLIRLSAGCSLLSRHASVNFANRIRQQCHEWRQDLQQHLWLGQWVLLGPLKSSIHRRVQLWLIKNGFKYCKTAAPAKPSSKKAARRSYVCLSATNPEAKGQSPKAERIWKPWQDLWLLWHLSKSLFSLIFLTFFVIHLPKTILKPGVFQCLPFRCPTVGPTVGPTCPTLQRSACRCGQTCPRRLALRPRCRPAFTRPEGPFVHSMFVKVSQGIFVYH